MQGAFSSVCEPPVVRFLLLPLGTYGDVKTFLDLGVALKRRGHEVILGSAEPFQELTESQGLRFESILGAAEYRRCLADPLFWHRRYFFRTFAAGLMLPSVEPILDLTRSLPRPKEWNLVAGYIGSPGARLASELTGAGFYSLWPSPAGIRSEKKPALLSGTEILRLLPPSLARVTYNLVEHYADSILAAPLNQIRRKHGLSEISNVLQWMVSDRRSICLFPAWWATVQPDWPADSRTVGFPANSNRRGGLEPELERFLEQGETPVVVTFGTGLLRQEPEFRTAVEAARTLGLRVAVVAPRDTISLRSLPTGSALFEEHPSFAALFPRVRAVIHHGGIGTTVEALRAACPQLVVPLAHDQPDTASRLVQHGAGASVSRSSFNVTRAARALSGIFDPDILEACRGLASRLDQEDGIEGACLALEEL